MKITVENLEIEQRKKDLINAEFITSKGCYKEDDRPFFCIACGGKTLSMSAAEMCREKGHKLVQGKKCSGKYGYRVCDVKELFDLNYVSFFSINCKYIYFPKSRKEPSDFSEKKKMNNNADNCCITCGFEFKNENAGLFCSILCKLVCPAEKLRVASMANQNRLVLPPKDSEQSQKKKKEKQEKESKKRKVSDKFMECEKKTKKQRILVQEKKEENKEKKFRVLVSIAVDDRQNIIPHRAGGVSFRKRSRKGIPCRAPLF